MKRALNVLKDHVAAVMDVSFSPTGEELVSASYDKTIRLWDRAGGHSRDIYHSKRMQRVFVCCYSPDSNYILVGLFGALSTYFRLFSQSLSLSFFFFSFPLALLLQRDVS